MTVNIKLDETYKISSDSRQYILMKKTKVNSEYQWKPIGFYSTIIALLEAFISRRVRAKDISSIKELMEYQKSLAIHLNNALKPLQIRIVTGEETK